MSEPSDDEWTDAASEIIATGGILMALGMVGINADLVTVKGYATNMIKVRLRFMKPTYMITVTKVPDKQPLRMPDEQLSSDL